MKDVRFVNNNIDYDLWDQLNVDGKKKIELGCKLTCPMLSTLVRVGAEIRFNQDDLKRFIDDIGFCISTTIYTRTGRISSTVDRISTDDTIAIVRPPHEDRNTGMIVDYHRGAITAIYNHIPIITGLLNNKDYAGCWKMYLDNVPVEFGDELPEVALLKRAAAYS